MRPFRKRNLPDKSAFSFRQEFSAALSKLSIGMSQAEAVRLLGEPDVVQRREEVLPSYYLPRAKEIWGYGIQKSNTYPSLGQLWIGDDQLIEVIIGNEPPDESLQLFQESEIRKLLQLIALTPHPDGTKFDFLFGIRIINTLQTLNKEKVLSVIEEHLRIGGYERFRTEPSLALLLRVLFDTSTPPRLLPETFFGTPHPKGPSDASLLPSFPMCVIGDVPLNVIHHFTPTMSTGIHTIKPLLDQYREEGTLRVTPLTPTDTPFVIIEELFQLPAVSLGNWLPFPEDRYLVKLAGINQLLRLVSSVYEAGGFLPDELSSSPDELEMRWESHVKLFQELNVRWDENQGDYEKNSRGQSSS